MSRINGTGYRPTWAEIRLENVAYNFKQVKKIIAAGTKIMVTVKADAYGHGLIPISRKLVSCGVDYLGVASIDEGIKLREAGIKSPVLILGVILKKDIAPLFKYDLTPTVCDRETAVALNSLALKIRRPVKVHVKVDTGMGRIGVLHQDAAELVNAIHKLKFISIEGLFTHFPMADLNKEFTLHQVDLFNRLVKGLKRRGINIPLLHAANSAALIYCKQSHLNMVRPGLVVYGLHPEGGIKIDLKPVLSLKTKIVFAKRLPAGSGVSYGHDYLTKREATVVTLPIGYGDGYPRHLSNLAPVLIRGKRYRISGRICMDQIMVDVGNERIAIGDEVVLIGSQGRGKISAEELAGLSGTIPYEIVCGLGSRIPRVYI